MTKYLHGFLGATLLLLGGCQSVDQLSIDYMLPADISFPGSLKRVAVVNNTPNAPQDATAPKQAGQKQEDAGQRTNCHAGNAALTAEALAQALAQENYFDEVIICDSALCSQDTQPRESLLSSEAVNQLTQDLQADFLISLEDIQLSATRQIEYWEDWGIYYGTTDVKVFPTVRIYLPNRKGPLATIHANDSIFWEADGLTENAVQAHFIGEKEMIDAASEFAGTVPVKYLLPSWKTAYRYFFNGGSVHMRDAAVYAREANWEKAIELWKRHYDTKKGKQQMRAAYNIALGYEMQDSIYTALEWAIKAQSIARQVDKIDEKKGHVKPSERIPNYLLTTLYVQELQERKEGFMRLESQMNRFEEE